MISVEKNKVVLRGRGTDLMAEFAIALSEFRSMLIEDGNPKEEVDEILDKILETTKMSDEEIHEEAEQMKKAVMKEMSSDELFKRFFSF